MATLAPKSQSRQLSSDNRFFLVSALLMTAIVFGAFSFHLSQGRSSFAAPILYHLHAVVFMGWVTIYLAQTAFATVGPIALHRRLGWLAVGWMLPMAILGPALTIDRVQAGQVPFFFQPQHFLIANPLGMLAFLALTGAAVVKRRQTDWHRRLHLCGMSALLGPAFGRLLPSPLMEPFAFQAAVAAGLVLPLAGMNVDRRHGRGLHRAWLWGIGAVLGALLLSEGIARSPVGDAIYRAVTAGTPGATVAAMDFAAPPGP